MQKYQVMGVLNLTPDSFSDGGQFNQLHKAIDQGLAMHAAGADYIDIGGESSRPGAVPVPLQQELDRVIPVIEALLKQQPDIKISIDTSKTKVMAAAIHAGACLVNDINALQAPNAIETVAKTTALICLMHKQGQPNTMQQAPQYTDVVTDVYHFLKKRSDACLQAGITKDKIIIDPGFGFGKTLQHNTRLIQSLTHFKNLNYPLLIGVSRKSMIGQITNKTVDQRLAGGLALAFLAIQAGVQIIRTHDVAATIDIIKIWQHIQKN